MEKDEGRKKNDSRKKKDYPFSLESWNSPNHLFSQGL
jgi:hypothetical protein